MHKIAILSDIHGNLTALEAVLADAQREQVTQYWIMGDLLMPGPGSSDLLQRLRALPNVTFLKGNWDDWFLKFRDLDLDHPTNLFGARLAMYQLGGLSREEIDFLENVPLFTIKKIEGFDFLLCHNLPDNPYGGQLWISAEQGNFDSLFAQHQVDVAVYGHVHHQTLRYSSKDQLIINPGAVCISYFDWQKHHQANLNHAQYAIIEVTSERIGDIRFKKVAYDIEQEIKLATERNLPYLDLYIDSLKTGRNYTHDHETLTRVNSERGYKAEVLAYFKDSKTEMESF